MVQKTHISKYCWINETITVKVVHKIGKGLLHKVSETNSIFIDLWC